MKTIDGFMSGFNFNPDLSGKISCEREMFLFDDKGNVAPWSPKALSVLQNENIGYELSACQIESRVGPTRIELISGELQCQQDFIQESLLRHGITARYLSVAPRDMPLDVYPDERYLKIVSDLPKEVLLAACRVAGTHFHIGVPNWDVALHVYNRAVKKIGRLIDLGNKTNGERIAIYSQMAPNFMPVPYDSVGDMYEYYFGNGWVDKPRECYHLIRISVHGTVEFRMFDNTDSVDEVSSWGQHCLEACGDLAIESIGV